MRTLILALMIACFAGSAYASINYVDGYSRRDGTYVQGHYKDTSGDGYSYNNRKSVLGY